MSTLKINKETPEECKALLLNMLAVMHGDGGHYALKHGIRKATGDALRDFYRMKSALRDIDGPFKW